MTDIYAVTIRISETLLHSILSVFIALALQYLTIPYHVIFAEIAFFENLFLNFYKTKYIGGVVK